MKVVLDGVPVHRRPSAAAAAASARAWRRRLSMAVRVGGAVQTAEDLVWKTIVRDWLTEWDEQVQLVTLPGWSSDDE